MSGGELHPESLAVSLGRGPRRAGAPVNAPVVLSAIFHAGGDVEYGRVGNPTVDALEEAIGGLEGGECAVFASGMAASAAVLGDLPPGSIVVAPTVAYFEVRAMLSEQAEQGRLEVRWVDVTDTAATLAACDGLSLLWVESPANPLMGIADLAVLAEGAHRAGGLMVVDNTFATPLLQRPLDLGADLAVHSATKYISGHSDVLLGAVCGRDPATVAAIRYRRELYGAVAGPVEVFLALRGLRTLAVRLERAQSNAMELARRLSEHPAVERVRYPGLPGDPGHELAARQMRGFGGMMAFEVRGGAEAADRVARSVELITFATSLGGVESLIERRARWPGETAAPPNLLRFSVGIEHVEDLWRDLDRALRA